MKLNRLELRNFLSHTATDVELNGCRLATVVGANGAGKSSLAVDALRYALFDDARGRTDDLVQLGKTDMSVRVEFDFAGATYAVSRGRTTKSRGSSFLEFAIRQADGAWRPLTADTIRETQQAIGELLRMDPDTFDTAVLLGQGQANRFAEATAGERKRILAQVLGLDVYERAEVRAREAARDLEGRTAAERATVSRLDAELQARSLMQDRLDEALACAENLERQEHEQTAERDRLQGRKTELVAAIAAGEEAEKAVARAEADLVEQRARYQRVAGRKAAAEGRIRTADELLARYLDPNAIEAQAASLADLLDAEARLEALERQDQALDRQIREQQETVRAVAEASERAHHAWQLRSEGLALVVERLERDVAALPPITCPSCSHTWQHDQARLGEQLLERRTELRDHRAAEPKEPLAIGIERGKLARLESNRRELAFDAEALRRARDGARAASAAKLQAEQIAAQRAARVDAAREIAEAETEVAEINAAGKAARTALEEARAKVADLAPLRVELGGVETAIVATVHGLRILADERRKVQGETAQYQAALERLERISSERDELAASLAEADLSLGRLRRLVTAFGVTGIPARIIESVLPELGANANRLLAELRPGMELSIRAQRAKKDGKGVVEALDLVVADQAGERALAMFSGGERMSVSLALAVGLSQLVARRAGTAIRTLVIDEPDGLDADARRSFGQALRVLAHHGELERVVLVSHHQDLADVGDAVFEVRKDDRGSVVSQIA